MNKPSQSIRDFVFRALLFETEAAQFQQAGIKIGADGERSEQEKVFDVLEPFGVQRRNDAFQMARLYTLLHCFENELRSLISETLLEKVGADWWERIPKKVRDFAESRKEAALKDSWLEGEKTSLISFVEFGHLGDIMIESWGHFESIIPSQHWLKQRMDEMEKARNFVAHNRMLLPSEFQRLFLYVSDWNKIIGL